MKRLSRRTLLGASAAGAAGGASLFLSACGAEEEPSVENQAAALNDALTVELAGVVVYGAAPQALEGAALETAERFADQEREHADALREAIEALGGTPVEPLSGAEYAAELELATLEDEDEYLRFTVDLENTAIALYNAAVTRVAAPEARRTLFAALAADAGHLSVLLGELGQPQVPDAFVFGARSEPVGT